MAPNPGMATNVSGDRLFLLSAQACYRRRRGPLYILICRIAGWRWHGEARLLATRWQRWLGQPALPACAIVCAWMRTYGMPTTGWA